MANRIFDFCWNFKPSTQKKLRGGLSAAAIQRPALRILSALVLSFFVLELGAYFIRKVVLPPKWEINEITKRMEPGFSGAIDYADQLQGRGSRMGKLTVNAEGYRGASLLKERLPNELRLACWGSSPTFGWGAGSDETAYPAQLEKLLREKYPSRPVFVLNAGIPGNNAADELKRLREDLPQIMPDAVILWSGWPDWTRYLRSLDPEARRENNISKWLRKFSSQRLAAWLRNRLTPPVEPPSEESLSLRPGLKTFNKKALVGFEKNLREMISVCQTRNVPAIVLGLGCPLRQQPLSDDARRLAAYQLHVLSNASLANLREALDDFDQVLRTVTEETRTVYISPELLPTDPELFCDVAHMNDAGYRRLAESVFQFLTDNRVLTAP
jgi:lysophospholipase L1-like esterase